MSGAAVDPRPSNRLLYAATVVLLTLSIGVQVVRDRGWKPYEPANPVLWLQSGPLVKRLTLGYNNLAADFYWMRAVIYYGGKRRGTDENRNFDQLGPLLDLATTLDPRFKMAYRFGAIFLTENYPSGPGRPDLAIALLQRGLDANPTVWEYPHDIGFVYYWWIHDYQKAAEWFAKAGDLPGAASWLKALAATTLAVGGDRRSSRALWNEILRTTDEDWLRKSAVQRLTQLDAMDQIDAMNKVLAKFTASHGRPPETWDEVLATGLFRAIPQDPTGLPYIIDSTVGGATISRSSSLWPLPTDAPKATLR